jgi:glutathione synthase/RimK-type ligase-like ATP-grasp enzyme
MNNTDPLDLIEKLNITDNSNLNSSPEVLILTKKMDIESDLVGIQLLKDGIEYVKITEEDIPLKFGVEFSVGKNNKFVFKLGRRVFDCKNIKLVLFRYFDLKFLEYYSGVQQLYFQQQWYQLFNYLQTVLKCTWINHPLKTFEAENRLNQLLIAKNLGFNIPETSITNIAESAQDFLENNSNQTVVKVLHHHEITSKQVSHRFLTSDVDESMVSKFDQLKFAPIIFQEKIPKREELRITIIGNKIFPVKLTTSKDKKEYSDLHKIHEADLEFLQVEIDKKLKRMCLKMNNLLGLEVSSLDFIVDINGEIYFLEVNPIGDWNWLEKHLKLSITETVTKLIKKYLKDAQNYR